MTNPVVHFEINGGDAAAQHAFYASLLGWKVSDQGPEMGGYGLVDTQGGEGINGGIGSVPDTPPYTAIYVATADPQATLDKAESLGAKTIVPLTEIPGVVTFAMFLDRQGNMMGVVKDEPMPEGQSLGPSKGAGAPLGWFEISSADPKDARDFYTELFGWTIGHTTEEKFVYYHLELDDRGISGAIASAQDGASRVTLWAMPADLRATLDKAATIGGRPVMQPTKVSDGLTIAGLLDTAGNYFGLAHR